MPATRNLWALALTLLLASNVALGQTGCTTREVQRYTSTDFLFLIDASGSMCPYITQITSRMQTFVSNLQTKNVTDARFAVALYGGQPIIMQSFSVCNTVSSLFVGLPYLTHCSHSCSLMLLLLRMFSRQSAASVVVRKRPSKPFACRSQTAEPTC